MAKDLRQIPNKDAQRILRRIGGLAEDPRLIAVEEFTGEEKYRIRQVNYRILYAIDDNIITFPVMSHGDH